MHRTSPAERTRRRVSSRAKCRSRLAPLVEAASIERLAAGLPSRAWLPADDTSRGTPGWRASSRRARASAVGDRQMLPVQTNSTPNGPAGSPASSAGIVERLLEHAFQLLGRDGALAQQPRPLAGEVDDARRRAVAGRAGVEEHPDVVAELGDHLRDLV